MLLHGAWLAPALAWLIACTAFGAESAPADDGGLSDAGSSGSGDGGLDARRAADAPSTADLPPLPACQSVLLDVPSVDFSGSVPGTPSHQLDGDAAVEVTDGELVARVSLQGAGWAHYLWTLDGSPRQAATRFRMRVAGRSPDAHVGCKLVFGRLGSQPNVNARLALFDETLKLEISSSRPNALGEGALYPSLPDLDLAVALDVIPIGGGFRAEVTILEPGGRRVSTSATVVWDGGTFEGGALRCGILETKAAAAEGSLVVSLDDVSGIVCAD